MEISYYKHYSSHLNREMEFKVYGHAGRPVLFVPCQGGRFWDFEAFGMINTWGKWIDAGLCTVYSVDCIDLETYANFGNSDYAWRSAQHERWYNYVVGEFVPYVQHLNSQRGRDWNELILPFGCSMGAMHAANLFFRRPDLFAGCFSISGMYDPGNFFNGYMDEILYNNSPNYYLNNLPQDHYYMDMYNHRDILIVVGQGAWEDELLASTRILDEICCRKGINARFEYWGYDVNHDWPWWFKMCDVYVPQLLGF